MSYETVFSICNTVVLPGRLLLAILPRWKWTARLITSVLIPDLLGLVYLNLLFDIWACVLFLAQKPEIPSAYLWGIRLGFLLFLIFAVKTGRIFLCVHLFRLPRRAGFVLGWLKC